METEIAGSAPQAETTAIQSTERASNDKRQEAPDWYFDNIAALSHSARTLHVIYVGFLTFCALTIVGIDDRQIVLNDAAKLPLLNIEVRFSIFLIVGPLVATFVFVYFQLHLQALKRAVLELQFAYAVPPRGRLYPWMLTLAEDPEIGAFGLLQRIIVSVSLWWLLPIVLFLFTWLAFRTGNAAVTYLELSTSAVGLVLVFWLYNRYRNIPTSTGNEILITTKDRVTWCEENLIQIILAIAALTIFLYLLLIMRGANQFYVDLSGEELKGAQLRNTSLQSARLEFTGLEGADLYKANLQAASLSGALLQNANLRNSFLMGANLNCSNLSGAHLEGADLTGALLIRANLSGAFVTAGQLMRVKSLHQAILDPGMQRNSFIQNLLKEPPLLEDAIKSYQANIDPVPIAYWSRSTDPSELIGTNSLDRRTLLSDNLLLVRRASGDLLDVRFFLTRGSDATDKIVVSYLQTEEASPTVVPCFADEKHQDISDSTSNDQYSGKYELASNLILVISSKGGQLTAQFPAEPNQELFRISESKFFSRELNTQIDFTIDKKGSITALVLTRNGFSITGKKLP